MSTLWNSTLDCVSDACYTFWNLKSSGVCSCSNRRIQSIFKNKKCGIGLYSTVEDSRMLPVTLSFPARLTIQLQHVGPWSPISWDVMNFSGTFRTSLTKRAAGWNERTRQDTECPKHSEYTEMSPKQNVLFVQSIFSATVPRPIPASSRGFSLWNHKPCWN